MAPLDHTRLPISLAVWLSGNVLAFINVVVLRPTRLVPRWMTICRPVNHPGMKRATQVDSPFYPLLVTVKWVLAFGLS